MESPLATNSFKRKNHFEDEEDETKKFCRTSPSEDYMSYSSPPSDQTFKTSTPNNFLTSPTSPFSNFQISLPTNYLSLPKEIWKNNICPFLTLRYLGNLRLASRYFHRKIVVFPVWKQWIPYHQLEEFQVQQIMLGWQNDLNEEEEEEEEGKKKLSTQRNNKIEAITPFYDPMICLDKVKDPKVYGIYFTSNIVFDIDIFKLLPESLIELECFRTESIFLGNYMKNLPPSLQRITFRWSYDIDYVTRQAITYAIHNLPNLTIQFHRGFSLLYWLTMRGLTEEISILIKQRKDLIDLPNGTLGETALCLACRLGNLELAQLLLQNGADINKPCFDGWTPLITATFKSHHAIVSLLFKEYKANVYLTDKYGKTALTYANPICFSILSN